MAFTKGAAMRVRDLERMLIASGAGAAKIDAITRRLRKAGRLPKGGRGTNAPDVGASEAAAILIALAGSTKGPEADMRLQKLEGLPCSNTSSAPTLLLALTAVLEDPSKLAEIQEIRIGRTNRRACFVKLNGSKLDFHRSSDTRPTSRFYVEGVLPGPLLEEVRHALERPATVADSESSRPPIVPERE